VDQLLAQVLFRDEAAKCRVGRMASPWFAPYMELVQNWRDAASAWEQMERWDSAASCWGRAGDIERQIAAVRRSGNDSAVAKVELQLSRLAREKELAADWNGAVAIWELVGDNAELSRCLAQKQAARDREAAVCRARLAESREEWERAAEHWEQAAQQIEAARCWEKAERWEKAGRAWELEQQWEGAARCWEKAGRADNAARCWEQASRGRSDRWYCRQCRHTMSWTFWTTRQTRRNRGFLVDSVWYRCPSCQQEVELYPGRG
jgi:tetratricopeptide (TPR) repeat protein